MEDLGDPPTAAYWLAWAAAFLLIIAVVSAGVMNLTDDGSADGLVSAAGRTSGTVDGSSTTTTTTTVQGAPTPTSTTRRPTTPTSTTVPNAAAAVLKAIGTPPPPPSTTTTAPPVTSTTPTTATTSTTSTSTTLPPRATVTVVNRYDRAFEITVNGRAFTLGPAPSAPQTAQIDLPNVTDVIRGNAAGEPPCEVGSVGDLFRAGGTYEIAIVPGGTCAELRVASVGV